MFVEGGVSRLFRYRSLESCLLLWFLGWDSSLDSLIAETSVVALVVAPLKLGHWRDIRERLAVDSLFVLYFHCDLDALRIESTLFSRIWASCLNALLNSLARSCVAKLMVRGTVHNEYSPWWHPLT
ncbi:uncharacterized protein HMPREF1120_07185 [Exophiala dermatitidis NIH/UT8656]|uniref:Uncharacterized protein n=1 Tax=Exophiala dermatitidis (strain ATCC 34100 / CBS 525.76 / NIH/UT8656) TaxID=858893 RepID=H6C642_EXODN|nr:uncharacterized protein HMPREF1120_07185 [Exophiala dermatitidis NIH/UT8656]EHY59188.1 hypothetical protein HMPREF1120_07185 [Exophiala dermatitidis NIH/UT8656]